MVVKADTNITLAGLALKNPVMAASGTFGYGREFANFFSPADLGAIVVKGLSVKPRPGNPPPRTAEVSGGMLNAIGLENVGLEVFLEEKLPWLVENKVSVIANIFGETVAEYAELAQGLGHAEGISMIEVNLSCPNVERGGLLFGTQPDMLAEVVRAVVESSTKPVMVKLTPMVTDITLLAQAAAEAGASVLSLINTVPAMAVDINTRRPLLANVVGGLSGPAIKPIALKLVWQTVQAVDLPVVGGGGIMTAADALEFLMVGATAVQVGTASFVDPMAAINVVKGIEAFLNDNNLSGVSEIIGSLKLRPLQNE